MLNIRRGPHLGFNQGRLFCSTWPLSWGTRRGKLVCEVASQVHRLAPVGLDRQKSHQPTEGKERISDFLSAPDNWGRQHWAVDDLSCKGEP